MQYIKILEWSSEIDIDRLKYLEAGGFELVPFGEECNYGEVVGVIVRSGVVVDRKLIENYEGLRYVMRVWVGLDKIDLDFCKQRNIKVINTPGANSDAVADMAMFGFLSLLRNAKELFCDAENKKFKDRWNYIWQEVWSQVVGVVWFGRIGQSFYKRCVGFGVVEFCIVDPFLTEEDIAKFDFCKKFDSVLDIIKNIDVLAIFVPIVAATENLIDKKVLNMAKSILKILNLSRGWVVNEKDLYWFLENNLEASAYLDVWKWDPEISKNIEKFMDLKNCIISPHIATMTEKAIDGMHKFDL